MLKETIMNVLPHQALNVAFGIRARRLLKATSIVSFDPANLKMWQNLGEPNDFFSNPDIDSCWSRDSPRITEVFAAESVGNGVNPGDRRALYYAVNSLRPHNVLEVGTHVGASTIHIASALNNLNETTGLQTVDIVDVNAPDGPWKKVGSKMCPRDIARSLGLADMIKFHASPSLDFMKTSKDRFDLIFLDGDHFPDTVYKEVGAALKLLNPGGVIMLHDYYPGGKALFPDGQIIHGPYLAMERVRAESPSITTVPLGELPWPTKQGSRVTSLAFVVRH